MLAASDICWWCSHPGAMQVDHLDHWGAGGSNGVENLAPIHGNDQRKAGGLDYRCPTCGKSCNQERGGSRRPPQTMQAPLYRSREW